MEDTNVAGRLYSKYVNSLCKKIHSPHSSYLKWSMNDGAVQWTFTEKVILNSGPYTC